MRLRVFLAAVAVFLAFGGLAMRPAEAQLSAGLSGEWHGTYYGGGNAATDFRVTIRQTAGRAFSGNMIERRPTPQGAYYWNISTIDGMQLNTSVNFTKTYTDPNAGLTHAVRYRGHITDGGRRIRGAWYLDGAQGQFEMVR